MPQLQSSFRFARFTLREGTLVLMFCWYAREKWGSEFSLVAYEDCLEVCLMGLVVGRNCLVIVVIFMGFGQAGAKRCGDV